MFFWVWLFDFFGCTDAYFPRMSFIRIRKRSRVIFIGSRMRRTLLSVGFLSVMESSFTAYPFLRAIKIISESKANRSMVREENMAVATFRRKSLKPHWVSCTERLRRIVMRSIRNALSITFRYHRTGFSFRSPGMNREAMTISCPFSISGMKKSKLSTGMARSASRNATRSYCEARIPFRTALPFPLLKVFFLYLRGMCCFV